MENELKLEKSLIKNIKYDLPAGLVVFLVALPLCLGIALASGAPLFSGILAGIMGGLVVPILSRSSLSVSGPAAGLTAIVLAGIEKLGTFEAFLAAVVIGGAVQLVLGVIKAGSIAYFFPSSVIKGMLAAIGLILILKQLPHAIGYDVEQFGLEKFMTVGSENTFSLLKKAILNLRFGALAISVLSVVLMILWDKSGLKKIAILPSALVVVVLGTLLNVLFTEAAPALALEQAHLVNLPLLNGVNGIIGELSLPDFSILANTEVWIVGLTIGLVASVETLLSLEAVDQLDPFRRQSPLNRELLAQGTANIASGLIGGLPVTAVIVRSSTNVSAGGRTRMSALFHGLFLLLAVLFLASVLNYIPLACLASILLLVGYKLAKPALFVKMYKEGWNQFLPFIVTVVAILFSDLLIGISIGLATGIFFVVRSNFKTAVKVQKEDNKYVVKLRKDVSFLNKATLMETLNRIPESSEIVIDGRRCEFIDHDIKEIIDNFKRKADMRNISVELRDMDRKLIISKKKRQVYA